MSKFIVDCEEWKPFDRNTLKGFAVIKVAALHLVIRDIAIHEKNGRRWAQLPAKPQIKDGAVVKDAAGKAQYIPIMAFTNRQVADAFSDAVIAAILDREPGAFGSTPPRQRAGVSADGGKAFFNDEIPF